MFLFDKIVRIINRNSYTNGKRAASYCGRGLAVPVSRNEIAMLTAAELERVHRLMQRPEYDPVKGAFEWFVGDSGGSALMRQYEGISGGTRVFKAQRGDAH